MFYIRYGPTYTRQTTYAWDNSTNYQSFVADVDVDGNADLALRNPQSGMFYIRYGPTYTRQTTYTWDRGWQSLSDTADVVMVGATDRPARRLRSGCVFPPLRVVVLVQDS